MAGTKEGGKIIKEILKEVKQGLQEDEFNEAMNEISGGNEETTNDTENTETFDFTELLGGSDSEGNNDNSSDNIEGYDFEDLF